jgi:hypothetical protein
MENFRKHFPESDQIKYFEEKYDALKKCRCSFDHHRMERIQRN